MSIKNIIYTLIIATFLPSLSVADVSFCFESPLNNGKSINLKFSLQNNTTERGFIRYKNGNADIEIKKISEKSISTKTQIPATIQSKWQEEFDGEISGYYYLTTTGTNAGGLFYVRKKDKRHFQFFDDRQNPELNCGWD